MTRQYAIGWKQKDKAKFAVDFERHRSSAFYAMTLKEAREMVKGLGVDAHYKKGRAIFELVKVEDVPV